MGGESRITGNLLIKNSVLNFIGQVLTFPVAMLTIPYVVSNLGAEKYGIFVLIRVFVDYFTVCEIGLGGAVTKFIAEALGKGKTEEASRIFWTSLFSILIIGVVSGTLFYFLVPYLGASFLKVSPNAVAEMKTVFRISSLLLFGILLKSFFMGVLGAYQRFGLLNIVRTPSMIVSLIIPVVLIYLGYGLTAVVLGIVASELVTAIVYCLICLGIAGRKHAYFLDLNSLKSILCFGGWLSVIKIISCIMINIQRLFIGSLIAVVYVTYYSIPFSLTSTIGIIGTSIAPVVYSAISAFHISHREKYKKLVSHSLKGMAILYGLPSLVFVVFSKEVMLLWMGEDFHRSIIVLQILSVGMFFGGMSWILGTFLQGIGKPKAITLVAVIQVPIDILLTWLLIKNFGITGAALAWALLRGLGAGLLYLSCKRFHVLDFRLRVNTNYIKGLSLILLVLLVNVLLKTLHSASLLFLVVNALILIVGYMFVALNYLLDSTQKRIVIENVKLFISVLLMRKVQGQTVQNT